MQDRPMMSEMGKMFALCRVAAAAMQHDFGLFGAGSWLNAGPRCGAEHRAAPETDWEADKGGHWQVLLRG